MYKGWEGFTTGKWSDRVDVRDFIQRNYTEYTGDEAFLAPATESTLKLWKIVMELSKKEAEAGGVLDMDTGIVSSITSHGPGYLDRELETIVGFQTDKPLKRSLQPYGGIRVAEQACEAYGYKVDEEVEKIFTKSIIRECLTCILLRCVLPESRALLQGFQMPMAEEEL